jgi:hypothetical protein
MLPWPVLRPSISVLAAMTVTGAAIAAPASPPALLHDTQVVSDASLIRGAPATVAVVVTGARSLRDSVPLGGAEIELALAAAPDRASGAAGPPAVPRRLVSARADATGRATLRFRMPTVAPGSYRLLVTTRSPHGVSTTERAVSIEDKVLLHLRTDSPCSPAMEMALSGRPGCS